jgi:hypothetical protein
MANDALSNRYVIGSDIVRVGGFEHSSMDDLPEELVVDISSYLSFGALAKLSCTSKCY